MEQVDLRDYYEEAASLVGSGELDKAMLITRHILHHYPRYIAGHQLMGQALLESGNHREAAKWFLRVLSADPENVTARLGLSRVYGAVGKRDRSIEHMQLACDLSPGDSGLREQLGQLMKTHRSGATGGPEITRAGLGRIYARNGLYPKSIQEFKDVLAQEPTRFDVRLALAEVLWRDGRHLEAVEACHYVLNRLPHALKANLIVAAVWLDSPQPDEAQPYLRLAQALDPENVAARLLFGDSSPLPPGTAEIDRMDEAAEQPDSPPSTPRSAAVPYPQGLAPSRDWANALNKEETAAMSDERFEDEEFEIPDWLKGVGDELLAEEVEQPMPSATTSMPPTSEEAPEWLSDMVAHAEEASSSEVPATAPSPYAEESADMSGELELPPVEAPSAAAAETPDESKLPGWLSDIMSGEEMGETVPATAPTPAEPAPEVTDSESRSDMDDWITKVAEAEVETAAAPEESQPPQAEEEPVPIAAEPVTPEIEKGILPDWLSEIAEAESVTSSTEAGEPGTLPAELASLDVEVSEADLPDWLQDFEEQEAVPDVSEDKATPPAEPTAEVEELPEWLQPEADELTAEEAEAAPAGETEIPVWLTEDTEPVSLVIPETETAEPAREVAEAEEKGLPDWLRELQQSSLRQEEPVAEPAEAPVPAEASQPVDSETEPDMPDWLRRLRDGAPEEATAVPASDLKADLAAAAVAASLGAQLPAEEVILPEPSAAETPVEEAPSPAPVEEEYPETEEPVEAVITAQTATPTEIEEAAPTEPELAEPVASPPTEPLQVEALPKEPEARLALARAALRRGSWSQALSIYSDLVNSSELLNAVIDDLEEGIRRYPEDSAGYQLVGDAYMKDGRLPYALQSYRTALAKLH